MRKLTFFSLKAFIGPFLITFVISVFLLVMQFFWKYIDDMMGKGLDTWVILKLMFYVSASIIPLALPLSILLSSIMTLGNLGESNELTALKSAGASLLRILRPLFFMMIFMSAFAFYFTNYVLPIANLKWRAIIYDIQHTKIADVVREGQFNTDFDRYAIKVDKKEGNSLKDILIYDHTNPMGIKVIRSKEGDIRQSQDGNFLFITLYNGAMYEDIIGNSKKSKKDYKPFQKSTFKSARLKFSLADFKMGSADENIFRSHEMMNVFQLNQAIDSINKQTTKTRLGFKDAMRRQMYSLNSLSYLPKNEEVKQQMLEDNKDKNLDTTYFWDNLTIDQKINANNLAIGRLRGTIQSLEGQDRIYDNKQENIKSHVAEIHKRYTLAVAILVLFFIGAPLGAIVKKGGFGAPVIIAVLLFMFYYVISITGENMVQSDFLEPGIGMWLSTIVLAPIAFWLTLKAMNDSKLFRFELIPRLKARFANRKK